MKAKRLWIALGAALYLVMVAASWRWVFSPTETHNAAGGYIDACGDLPGLYGDDC